MASGGSHEGNKKIDFNETELQVLLGVHTFYLKNMRIASMRDLMRYLNMENGSMVTSVKYLRKKGMLEPKGKYILTKKGKETAIKIAKNMEYCPCCGKKY